ncbi:hypothetical protein SAMN05216359_101214 [Roseateles sp. YR242]|uniref:hypothetical protein n=1 Tax=Roseateles sp. YR242 TaxID=1855305 RepID=UPI0008D2F373|nr:hypothetical protein [Roseateles sp. YR242]SEK26022.1 hypothetical protein SAMN05216359_101214 [Roseateles sp. YR242]
MNKPTLTTLFAAAIALSCGMAQAANFSKSVYDGAKDDIKKTYKVDKDACDKLSGNAKDICVEEAKGREKVALAQLEYNYSGSSKDETKVVEARYEARYDIAKERCDDRSGDAKDVCTREAKTAYEKAKADTKMNKKVAEAVDDAEEARVKADYKLASEKCSTLAGDAKDVCVNSAKARYNQR